MSYWASWRHLRRQVPKFAYRQNTGSQHTCIEGRQNLRRTHNDYLAISLFGQAVWRRLFSTSACQGAHGRSGDHDPDSRAEDAVLSNSNEQRLVHELQLLLQTGSQTQRETSWGLFMRLVWSGIGVHTLASKTVICLVELIAGDKDSSRALSRIAYVLENISSKRELKNEEIETIRLIWEHFQQPKEYSAVWIPFSSKRGAVPSDLQGGPAVSAPQIGSARSLQLMTDRDSSGADVNIHRDPESVSQAVLELRRLLELPPILVDQAHMWETYRIARCTRASEAEVQLCSKDMRLLMSYCASLGHRSGSQFLMQIEIDLATNPNIFPYRHRYLIMEYAKLGGLDHSWRIYRAACSSTSYKTDEEALKRLDTGMWRALFSALHHKEGRAIVDRQLKAGQMDIYSYPILISEYVLKQNIEQAFALFDYMCERAIPLDNRTANMLAAACALDADAARASERLATVIACMRSWRRSPEPEFFIGLLKGYDQSHQHDMFDGLAAQLKARNMCSGPSLDRIIMTNAARRGDAKLAMLMASLVVKSPKNIPSVVKALCSLGQAEYAAELVSPLKLPDNNIVANVRLQLAIADPVVAVQPQKILDQAMTMIGSGFTPSFGLYKALIRKIWFHGGRHMAMKAYKGISAAGVPRSIGVLKTVLPLYLYSSTPKAAIEIYKELKTRLAAADLDNFLMPKAVLDTLMLVLIRMQGVGAAQDAFDFLSTIPLPPDRLPVTPLIEYYLNYGKSDKLQALLTRFVQQDIPLDKKGIDLCCKYLGAEANVADFANFLRYLERTGMLNQVSDTMFEKFFVLCADEYRVIDFEWAVGALGKLERSDIMWHDIIDCLSKRNTRVLLETLRAAIRQSGSGLEMAKVLLRATKTSVWKAMAADMIARVLRESNIAPDGIASYFILQAIVLTWNTRKELVNTAASNKIGPEFLVDALKRNTLPAVEAGVAPGLISAALLIVSSSSKKSCHDCLGLLDIMRPDQREVQYYGAIARGCAAWKYVGGVDSVMRAMNYHTVAPNVRVMNIIMGCYVSAALQHLPYTGPLTAQHDEDWQNYPDQSQDEDPEHGHYRHPEHGHYRHPEHGHHQYPENGHHRYSEQEQGFEYGSEAAGGPTAPGDNAPAGEFFDDRRQQYALEQVMSIWDEFEHRGLSPDHETYTVMIHAMANARRFDMGENVVAHLVEQGPGHNESTVYGWIRLRILNDDIDGALTILRVLGDAKKCEELASQDIRYQGLQTVARVAKHFVIFIQRHVTCEDLDTAMFFFRHMHKQGFKAQSWLYSLMLTSLANADRRELFVEVMKQMVASDVILDENMMEVVREYSAMTRTNDDSNPQVS